MQAASVAPSATDSRGRALADLRISVTDRCNFRCGYCMPREHFGPGFAFLPRAEILSFEEITRVARAAVSLGVKKLRLTGGEPLLRAELWRLVEMLATTGADLALTTNGSLLAEHADALKNAGLGRLTISLDSLDDAAFRAMNDVDFPVARVLDGITAAERAGFRGIKLNCVVRRGQNDHSFVELARHFKGSGHIVRFIEFMDVGLTNGWRLDQVVSGREIVAQLDAALGVEAAAPSYRGEVARRWRYRDGSGEVGVITSVTQPFCGDCSRARLSADGKLYTCLFAQQGTDLRPVLRAVGGGEPTCDPVDDEELRALFESVWARRQDRYSELRSDRTRGLSRVEMSYIGG